MIALRLISPLGDVTTSSLGYPRIEIYQNVFNGVVTVRPVGEPEPPTFDAMTSLPILEIGSDDFVRCVDDRVKGRPLVHHNGRRVNRGASFHVRMGDVLRIDDWSMRIGPPRLQTTTAHEERFLEGIDANPNDDELRSVYADWLEEHGRLAAAEFLRLQTSVQRASADDPKLPKLTHALRSAARDVANEEWRWRVSRPMLERSPSVEPRFEVVCPKQWENLRLTDNPRERFCDACEQAVTLATSLSEARTLAWKGACVALDFTIGREKNDLEMKLTARLGSIRLR